MKRLVVLLVLCTLLLFGIAHAQIGITYFPGPGMSAAAGGCVMTGIFDLTNTCNDIYLLTEII